MTKTKEHISSCVPCQRGFAIRAIITAGLRTRRDVACNVSTMELAASNSPATWAVASGKLPTWLTFNASTGVIPGTPTAAGLFNFSITARNGDGASAAVWFSIIISSPTGINDIKGCT